MNSTSSEAAAAAGVLLRILRTLPGELALQMPLLSDIAVLSGSSNGGGSGGTSGGGNGSGVGGASGDGGGVSGVGGGGGISRLSGPGLIQRRLDRRYARICVVYRELSRLDFSKAASGTGLEDMVFAQTDFDRYQKISREDFNVFFDEGLEDFEDSFYKYNLMMDRGAVRKTIFRWYRREGECYICSGENPLLTGIMRTLHTALDFAPLLSAGEVLGESAFLIRFLQSKSAMGEDALSALEANLDKLFFSLITSLDGARAIHPDGMATRLFIQEDSESPILCGTFCPEHKAHTIRLTRPA